MQKNVLLINPWIHDFAAFDFWTAPLGLLYLGAILKKNDCHVSFIDCLDPRGPLFANVASPRRNKDGSGKFIRSPLAAPRELHFVNRPYSRYGLAPEMFIARLKAIPPPKLVMVTSMMTYWYPGVFEAIALTRAHLPGVPIVLGGIYATLCPDHARAHSGADLVITGPGECKIRSLFNDILGTDLAYLPDTEDLDSYPYPALELAEPIRHAPVRTSRGCSFRCTYCASALLNRKFHQRNPEAVAAELSYWHTEHNVSNFAVYDDAFLVNSRDVAVPLLKEIRRRLPDCVFHAPNGMHLTEITPEIAKLLFQARFKTIRFGFETADPHLQQTTGGKVKNEELLAAVSYLCEAGYRSDNIGIYVLTGLPDQTGENVRTTLDFVKSSGARPIIAEYSPVPGTALWERSVELSPFDLTGEPLFHNNTILPCQSDRLTYNMLRSLKKLAREEQTANE